MELSVRSLASVATLLARVVRTLERMNERGT